jgi:NADH:ubiquinone oxidoreductase subunit 3 (subunit A)
MTNELLLWGSFLSWQPGWLYWWSLSAICLVRRSTKRKGEPYGPVCANWPRYAADFIRFYLVAVLFILFDIEVVYPGSDPA